MPCSEPRFPALEKHQEQAIPLLCEAIRLLRDADGAVAPTAAMQRWMAVHEIIDELPGGWRGYAAGEIMERVDKIMKGK